MNIELYLQEHKYTKILGSWQWKYSSFNSELPLPALTCPNTSSSVILNAVQQERSWELGVSTARCCVTAG